MTSNFKTIQDKLEAFIRRYYTNELLKGAILFFAIGLLYLLLTLFVEHLLWLGTTARTLLFWTFIWVEGALLIKFIVLPLAKLFKLKKGIDYKEASKIIGHHFPEVNDKLLNVLQLHDSDSQSELLLASIEQKAVELSPIPFKLAINFKQNLKYLKYAAIPLLIILATYVSGHVNWFSDSYKRVVHYNMAYEPPAPFRFLVVNQTLDAIENKPFTLQVKAMGSVLPETAAITYNNETYILQQKGMGEFEYVFSQPIEPIDFKLQANGVTSKPYTLNIVEVPSLLSFNMVLNYPTHTQKKTETLKSTGNALVPEGTTVTWKLKTKATNQVKLYAKDTLNFTQSGQDVFTASKSIFNNFDYSLSTSNQNLKDYENLGFKINVIKDEYPELKVEMKVDTTDNQTLYFRGQATDDYGLTKLQLVYYPTDNEAQINSKNIAVSNTNVTAFLSAFPDNLEIVEGVSYTVFFQVFDNDVVNKHKSVKSNFFTYRKRTKDEETNRQLNQQNETIKNLDKSLNTFKEQEKQLENLSKTQKEKNQLNFNDKKKLESFLERQKQQDDLMKQFNKQLQDNIEKLDNKEQNDTFKEELKQRIEDNEKQLEKDEKLLEELKELQDKINKEELVNKLDQLAKQNKNKQRSLEQLLELTKRYYVQQKLDKLKEDLLKIGIDQEKLSNAPETENTKEKQDELNQRFNDFQKQMDALKKEDKKLKKPIGIPQDKLEEEDIKKEQQQATDALEKQEGSSSQEQNQSQSPQQNMQDAQKSQKNAAKKIKKMAEGFMSAMSGASGEQLEEDVEMLRQILDNLVVFSFDEEALMNQFKSIDINHNKFSTYLKKQNSLREHFEHVDDSLFALSLRQPKLSENVNKEITEVYYNIDKALDLLAENMLYQGVSNQQFTVTAANNLADFLSDVLDNMEAQLNMIPSPGQGSGNMQLPDIIMSQEELNKMMEQGMKESEGKQEGEKGQKEEKKEGEKEGGEKGNKEGQGKEGEQQGDSNKNNEYLEGLLFEIYKQQQDLRNQLQDKLSKEGLDANSKNLLNKMENIEMDLLNKGFTKETMNKMLDIKHQLLKLENATLQQGQEEKRESETTKKSFSNDTNNDLPNAKQYFNTTEILNKQNLPLRPIYKKKVQTYFQQNHD